MKLYAAVLISSLLSAAAVAAPPATPVGTSPAVADTKAQAGVSTPGPASSAETSVTASCKDGTTFSGPTRKGACSGHQGVKTWGKTDTVTNPMTATLPATKAAGQAASAPLPTAAAGGGVGKVWVNSKSNTYHCQTDRFYGKTKEGAYMTEAEAKAKGAHADHGKACT